jgi:hypothetical protein
MRIRITFISTVFLVFLLYSHGMTKSSDAIQYIWHTLKNYPIVCLGEGRHQAKNTHDFFKDMLNNKEIQNTLDVIIVEFANSRYQAILDDYILGKDIPYKELCKVWRNTTQSPRGPWDSPLYFEFLKFVREINQSLAEDRKIRVLGGDPPIDWEEIKCSDDRLEFLSIRNIVPSDLAIEQAFKLNKKVLILFGGGHLSKAYNGPKGNRNRYSITYYIQLKYPGSVKAIDFLRPEDLKIGERISELKRGMIVETENHWIGEISAELLFPGIIQIKYDEKTGKKLTEKATIFKGYLVKDIYDALIYIGPSSEWEFIPASPESLQDKEYQAELNRRRMIK